jgi:photosynthetic reaction center cytochrome c subunit
MFQPRSQRSQLRDEITALLLRGGLIGLAAFAVALSFIVVPRLLGTIWPTAQEQTGFRGTGMLRIEFEQDLAGLGEVNQLPDDFMGGPIPPEEGEQLAGDIYENVQVLGHLTDANFNRLMLAITEWVGQGEGCAYCHGDTGEFASDDIYSKVVARRTIEVTWAINEDWSSHVQETGVTCYTCHRGNQVPEYVWFLPEVNSRWAGSAARFQNLARPAQNMTSNYSTSLPVDALAIYLLEDSQPVAVHGLAALDQAGVSNASIYHTYQTYNLMMHFSSALGTNCTYCHNTRSLPVVEGLTPQWANAQIGRQMVLDINNAHVLATEEYLPAHRLGPLGDVAKVNCTTCHRGVVRPLGGQSMLPDWPELASREPIYEAAAPE